MKPTLHSTNIITPSEQSELTYMGKPGIETVASPLTDEQRAQAAQATRVIGIQAQLEALNDVYLAAEDDAARARIEANSEYKYLLSDAAKQDQDGQDYLMGHEYSQILTGGDTYEALDRIISALPAAKQNTYRADLSNCKTYAAGLRLLGRINRESADELRAKKEALEQKLLENREDTAEAMVKSLDIAIHGGDVNRMAQTLGLKGEVAENITKNWGAGGTFRASFDRASRFIEEQGLSLQAIEAPLSDEENARVKQLIEENRKLHAQGNFQSGGMGAYSEFNEEEARQEAELDVKRERQRASEKPDYDLAEALVELREDDPNAYSVVMMTYAAHMQAERNLGKTFRSPFAARMGHSLDSSMRYLARVQGYDPANVDTTMRVSAMGGAPTTAFVSNSASTLSPEQDKRKATISDIQGELRAMRTALTESPDGASWFRQRFDELGAMAADTTGFLATRGAITFASATQDTYEGFKAQGVGEAEAVFRSIAAGGVETAVEYIGGESVGRLMRVGSAYIPGMRQVTGYIGGAGDMLKRGMYKSAGARYGVAGLVAGGSEMAEEVIAPTVLFPLDNALAWAFDSDSGMTIQDWKDRVNAVLTPETAFNMLAFGLAVGGAQLPGYHREAQIARVGRAEIQAATGCNTEDADRVASIVEPSQKADAIRELAALAMDKDTKLANVQAGLELMQANTSSLMATARYQAQLELGQVPRYEVYEDGTVQAFDRSPKEEGGYEESTTPRVLTMQEYETEARTLAEADAIEAAMAVRSNLLAKAVINSEGFQERFNVEALSDTETLETLEKMATAAGLKIKEGAEPTSIDPTLSPYLSLKELQSLPNAARERLEIAKAQGEDVNQFRSNAYRMRTAQGKQVMRFVMGKVSAANLIEETVETHLDDYLNQNGLTDEWAAALLRELQAAPEIQKALNGKNLIAQEGEASRMAVLESMGLLARADVLTRIDSLRVPEFVKDFLRFVRSLFVAGQNAVQLGQALNQLHKAGRLNPQFAQAVFSATDLVEEAFGAVKLEDMGQDVNTWEALEEYQNNLINPSPLDDLPSTGEILSDLESTLDAVDVKALPETSERDGKFGLSFSTIENPAKPMRFATTREEAKEALRILSRGMLASAGKKGSQMKPITGKGLVAPGTDYEVYITGRTIEKSTSGKAYYKSIANLKKGNAGEVHSFAVSNMDVLWETSTDLGSEKDRGGNRSVKTVPRRISFIESPYGPLQVKLTAKLYHPGQGIDQLYSVEVQGIEQINKPDGKWEERSENSTHTLSPHQAYTDTTTPSEEVNEKNQTSDSMGESSPSMSLIKGREMTADIMPSFSGDPRVKRTLRNLGAMERNIGILLASKDNPAKEARAMALLTQMSSLMAELNALLPPKHRMRILPKMRIATALARMISSGKVRQMGILPPEVVGDIRAELAEYLDQNEAREAQDTAQQAERDVIAQEKAERQKKKKSEASTSLTMRDNARIRRAGEASLRADYEKQLEKLATQRIEWIYKELVTEGKAALEAYESEKAIDRAVKAFEQLLPRVGHDRKLKKGKVSAEDFRRLRQRIKMMTAHEDTVTAQSDALDKAIADVQDKPTITYEYGGYKEELDEAGMEDLAQAWLTYGAIESKALPAVLTAVASFIAEVRTGQTKWASKSQLVKDQAEHLAGEIYRAVGKKKAITDSSLARKKEEARSSKLRNVLTFFSSLQNIHHRLSYLREKEGFSEFVKPLLSKLGAREVNLNRRRNEHTRAKDEIIIRNTGLSRARERAAWFEDNNTVRATGLVRNRRKKVKVKISRELAEEYMSLANENNWDGMQALRKRILEDAKRDKVEPFRRGYLPPEGVEALKSSMLAHKRARSLVVEYETVDTTAGATEEIQLSRFQAAYLLLIWEQTRYQSNLTSRGYTEEVIQNLYEYCGEEVMGVAYDLRSYLQENGKELAAVFEKLTGNEFPTEENYYRAQFGGYKQVSNAEQVSFAMQTSGQKYGMLKQRTTHNAAPDFDLSVFSVFDAAIAEQDNYIETKEITEEIRAVISHPKAADALCVELGVREYVQLLRWCDKLDGAGTVDAIGIIGASGAISKYQSAKAVMLLGYKALTHAKQVTGVINPLVGGEVEVGAFWYHLGALGMPGTETEYTIADMLSLPEFKDRIESDPYMARVMRTPSNEHYSQFMALAEMGVISLGHLDMWSNAWGHTAAANAIFAKLSKENEAAKRNGEPTLTREEMREITMDKVRQSLAKSAQGTSISTRSLYAAEGGLVARVLLFMGGESIQKIGGLLTLAGQGKWGKFAAAYASLAVSEQLVISLFNLITSPPDEEELGEWLIAQIQNLPTAPITTIPVIGGMVKSGWNAIGLGNYYTNYGSEVFPITRTMYYWGKIIDGTATWKDYYQASKLTFQCLAMLFAACADRRNSKAATLTGIFTLAAQAPNVGDIAARLYDSYYKEKQKKVRSYY